VPCRGPFDGFHAVQAFANVSRTIGVPLAHSRRPASCASTTTNTRWKRRRSAARWRCAPTPTGSSCARVSHCAPLVRAHWRTRGGHPCPRLRTRRDGLQPVALNCPGFTGGQNSRRMPSHGQQEEHDEPVPGRVPRAGGSDGHRSSRQPCESDGRGARHRGQARVLARQSAGPGHKQSQRDAGRLPGPSTAEKARIKELERENRELRQANEILKKGEPVKAVAHRGAIGSSPMGDGSSPLANAYLAQDRRQRGIASSDA